MIYRDGHEIVIARFSAGSFEDMDRDCQFIVDACNEKEQRQAGLIGDASAPITEDALERAMAELRARE